MTSASHITRIELANGTGIDLVDGRAGFAGIGAVTVDGQSLRSDRRPLFVDIRTPDGVSFCSYRLVRSEHSGDAVHLDFAMDAVAGGRMEWMVHEVRPRINTADWSAGPQPAGGGRLRLSITPVRRQIGGMDFTGMCYQYRYLSEDNPIYAILDRGTWEIGGQAVGNEIWMRSCFSPSIVRLNSVGEGYSTEWRVSDCLNPNIFQFLPLQTELQGFTFTASDAGVLITWATKTVHIRTLLEKRAGDDVIAHWHEHCADLASELVTSPIEVLFAPGRLDRTERANVYEAVRSLVSDTLHIDAGLRQERARPYGRVEEWSVADLDDYRRRALPKMADAGVKTVGLANHFDNNMNVWGVRNFCCNIDWRIQDPLREQQLTDLCRSAEEADIAIEMWGNTALSTLNIILDENDGPDSATSDRILIDPREGTVREVIRRSADPWIRNPSGAIEADHYTPIFAAVNLRDPDMAAYWHKCWRAGREKIGLSAIFMDSSFNMTSDKFHWAANPAARCSTVTADQVDNLTQGVVQAASRPQILSMYRSHLDMVVQLQGIGYTYYNEDLGVFGIHRHGPGIAGRIGNLFLWTDCIADFDADALRRLGADPDDIYFKGLAYRQIWSIYWTPSRDAISFRYPGSRSDADVPTDWHIALLKAYDTADNPAAQRHILQGEQGVIYRSDAQTVVWAFEDVCLNIDDRLRGANLLTGEEIGAGHVTFKRHSVHLFR